MIRIKICGNTTVEDVIFSAEAGVNYIGAIMAEESKRNVELQTAKCIFGAITGMGVAVTSTKDMEMLSQILEVAKPKLLQIHNEIDPREIGKLEFSGHIIKTISISANKTLENCLAEMEKYEVASDYFLLDNEKGGSGKVHDWEMSAKIVDKSPKPVFLAGGLGIHNVTRAIEAVKPYAVDVCSGVEMHPGKKDREKIRQFIEVVKHA